MLVVIAAVLSLASASPVALDVPFVPQSDALCGGAAAAMVYRYWGEKHATAESFSALVDRRAGGIAADVLVGAIARGGWHVDQFDGSLPALDEHLARGEPVIVLVAERRSRYHYVVVVGRDAAHVIVHDPSWGPLRVIAADEFDRRWNAAGRWAISVTPDTVRLKADAAEEAETSVMSGFSRTDSDRCATLLDDAISDVRARGLTAADDVFAAVRAECPGSAGPPRELAGIRFAQRRWRDAASLAEEALAIDGADAYAADVLGSSLFMLDDPVGALRAWNRIGKPTLDRVRISGVRHTRYEAINEAIDLKPGALLTAEAFERARRRLEDLPDRAAARLAIRPDSDGYAAVDIVITERAAVPRGATEFAAVGVHAAVDREIAATLPGFSGQGETWTASWRWWANRPRAAFMFAAPHPGGLPGVWSVNASWEAESYSFHDAALNIQDTRTHADLSVGDWLSARWRYTARGGVDIWTAGGRSLFVGGAIEHRLSRDRLSVRGDADTWFGEGATPGFSSAALRARWTSPPVVAGWAATAVGGLQRVSGGAPLALWPGAGDGYGRSELLRAHPMLDDGVINVTSNTAFGRSLSFANAEAQRWIETRWPVRFGIALFADMAHAAERAVPGATTQIDVGGGLRLHLPGTSRALRIDVAHGVRDGANALTVGWTY